MLGIYDWLVVYLPLWKMRVRQLGLFFPIWTRWSWSNTDRSFSFFLVGWDTIYRNARYVQSLSTFLCGMCLVFGLFDWFHHSWRRKQTTIEPIWGFWEVMGDPQISMVFHRSWSNNDRMKTGETLDESETSTSSISHVSAWDQWEFQDPIDWRYLPYIRPI